METHRVQKLLSNYGYCSRRKAEEIIQEGRVKVNGKTISIGDQATKEDIIEVDNKPVQKERKVYLMFNKPIGCVTALKDQQYKTVMDYIKIKERIFPIGRLDYNTSGLLLFTNDGDFAQQVAHPSREIKKTYMVGIHRPITTRQLIHIERGVELEDGRTAPAKAKKINPQLLELTIHEGKNRIIRRMFKEMEFKVISLERIQIGKLKLNDLKPGKYKKLSKEEINQILS